MQRGGCMDSKAHAAGTFEHLTCLDGALSVTVEGKTVQASAGDTLRYRADHPHKIDNMSDQESRALLLVAQPAQYRVAPPMI